MNHSVTVIEMNPAGVRLVVGYYLPAADKAYVLQALESEAIPVDNNGFLERKNLCESLMVLLNEAKKTLKVSSLNNFILLLPPDDFQIYSGSSTSCTGHDQICKAEYVNLSTMMMKQKSIPANSPVFVYPTSFTTSDNSSSDLFPLNVHSTSLTMNGDVLYLSSATLNYYMRILKDVGIPTPYLILPSTFATVHYLFGFGAMKTGFHLEFGRNYSYLSYVQQRRLLSSKQFSFGTDQMMDKASSILNVTPARMSELAFLFGFRKDAGFPYTTDEKWKLEDVSHALEEALKPFAEQIYDELEDNEPQGTSSVVVTGTGMEIDDLLTFLGTQFGKRTLFSFHHPTLGARSPSFIAGVGAIHLTKEAYLPPLQDHGKREDLEELSLNQFSRG